LDTENIFTAELRKILKYKEELLNDVNNMLYHHTDDVERLRKVVADTEEQFADYLQQNKMLGEEKGRQEKELEILREAAQMLVDMVDPAEEGEADKQPLLEQLRGAP
jgi:predicted phage tail protein